MRAARARALSSPLRIRILRICLHEARTNQEIAQVLHLNPGTCLHHVRTLESTGLLRAEEARRGSRGAREVPYLATRLSWTTPIQENSPVLVDTFLDEIAGLEPAELDVTRLGLKLSPEHAAAMRERFDDLFDELAALPADDDGEALSIFLAVHPDRQDRPPGARS
jgi:DNA-binding Lrp family transcriptional regulator